MADDQIAIVGAGCRFPGADNLDEFWRVLVNGENHVKDIPMTRWNNDAFYDEDQTAPGKIYVKKAGLLNNHDTWDNKLFGISDVEANRVDPQQRYVLECVHMALEDGGITRKEINGSKTGVIIGCMNDDYKVVANSDSTEVGSYTATGTSTSVISARVSYVYNLHGACLTLDTACSSALVAIHLASRFIRAGDCDMAICGGVSSILTPDIFSALCKARMMSKTGQCQSFCDSADGYARGEGCGIVILKSLKAAQRDGNKIWATVKTGCNQDGCIEKPMTAPSGKMQLQLLEHTYSAYDFNPSDIQYIEAHGTGTPRGDPTEINALGEFFSATEATSESIMTGSVKSNIGHTESAAGVAGLLKVLLMMVNEQYVPSLHIKPDMSNLNKNIKLSEYNLEIATSVKAWKCNSNGTRHAALNSFGFGGSNTHAILSQEVSTASIKKGDTADTVFPICISGVDEDSLKLNLSQFQSDIEETLFSIYDIANTSLHHRDIFPYRTLIFGNTNRNVNMECKKRIEAINKIVPRRKVKRVFVYCGVGTTWMGMCREFMQTNEIFRDTIDSIDFFLTPLTGWKIGQKFLSETNYEDPLLNHIAIFCIQVALTEVWKSFGIIPDAIIGQSVGEVAACYAANILSLEEAVQVIYHRSEILSRQTEGTMAVIGNVDISHVEDICHLYENKVCIAVYSSPKACTLSGNNKELKLITSKLQEDQSNDNIFVRELKVKCAYHSPLLQPCLTDIEKVIDAVFAKEFTVKSPENLNTIQMISTVTGEQAIPEEMRTGEYWAKNVRQPVMFMHSIKAAFDDQSFNAYMEIGPRPVLQAHLDNILKDDCNLARALPSMKAKLELPCLYDSMARLFELGANVTLSILFDPKQNQITTIPRYSFNRTGELFIPKRVKANLAGFSRDSSSNHMYVQSIYQSIEPTYQIIVDTKCTPFVYDHFLSERIVVPGATYVEAGFHIGVDLIKRPVDQLSVAFNFVKVFTPVAERQHQLDVDITTNHSDNIQFSVKHDANVLAIGTVSGRNIPIRPMVDIECLKAVCKDYKSKLECYDALKRFNFRYGDSLSLIQGSWVSESKTKCLAEIALPEGLGGQLSKTHFHPAIIDALFQMFGIIAIESFDMGMKNTFAVPKGVDAVVLNKPVETVMYALAEEVKKTENSTHYNAILLSKNGTVIAEMENFYTRIISDVANLKEKTYGYGLNWIDISDIERTDAFQYDNIALFSDGRNSRWLQELAKAVNENILTELKSEQLSHMLTLSGRTTIIYHVGSLDGANENSERDGYTDEAVKRFFDLKKLMVSCKRFKTSIRIFVITENTQPCPDRHAINCNGSELWGMLRSAVHEGFNENVFIVDVDGNNVDVKALMSLLSYPYDGNTEFLLSGTKLYQPRLYTDQRTNKFVRKIVATPSDQLAICSRGEMEVTEPYLLLSQEKDTMSSTVPITLESFTVHNKALYISTVGNSDISDNFLQNRNDNNYQLIAVEGRGTIQHSNKNVLFLYPIRASTTVHIPKECIIETANSNLGGTLILINIAVHIMSSIKRGTNVMVIKDNTNSDVAQEIFMKMLNKKGCKSQLSTFQELQNNPVCFLQDTILMTTSLVLGNWNYIKKYFPNLRKIISISIYLQEKLRISLAHVFPGVQFTVLSISDILSINGIRTAMPTIKKYFQQYCSNTATNETESSFLLRLPMESVHVKLGIQHGSLKCYCDKKNMFQSQACYIVVGGLTGLGWELLLAMAKSGAGLLVAMSRRTPSDEINENIKSLQETYSCQIVSIQADVTELASVQNAFTTLRRQFPNFPIKGIFHGAGVLSDSPLLNLTEENVKRVMIPKIQGAWNLHIASLELPLDYFVMHSSIVSIIGNLGQCNYAAANSFLDSFALYRRSKGLPAQSINWGALSVGMAIESEKIKSQLKQKGFSSIDQDTIREIFLQTVLNDTTNTVYADVEWKKLLAIPSFSLQIDKYSAFKKGGTRALSSNKKIHIDMSVLRTLDPSEKSAQVGAKVREIITDLVVIENDALTNETPFTEIGIDSMAAMSLSNEIDDFFNCRIEMISLLSESTTISTVIETIIQSFENSDNDTSLQIEETEITQNQLDMFISDDLTFMQKDFLENYTSQRNNPYFLLVIDIELMGVKFRLAKWKHILNHVLRQHSELRKKYFFTEDGNVKIDSSGELEVDVRKDPKINAKGQNGDVRRDMPPDIHNSLPISFRIAQAKGSTILRIIAHKVAMDNKGFSLLLADIGNTCQAVGYKKPLPPIRQSINVTSAVKESILPRIWKLSNFWKKYLDHDIRPITLGSVLHSVEYNYCCQSHTDVPTVTAIAVKNYISKLGISLYDFFMSLYQLYLHVRTKEPIIIVGTAADMRFHVPVLNNVITRCTNYMPILAHINEDSAIHTFIQGNSVQLSSTTLNGAYPSSLILQNIQSIDTRNNAFRHCFVMHDMTEMSKLSETDGGRARLKNVWHSTPDRETFIYLHYNLKTGSINLETGYNSKICGIYGQTFADDLLHLVNEAIEFGNKTIKDIREELIQNKNGSNLTTKMLDIKTLKEDTIGKRFSTTASVTKGVPKDMFEKKSVLKNIPDKEMLKPQWINFDSGKRISSITDYIKGHLTNKKPIHSIGHKTQHKTQSVIKSDPFEKQTTYGWDHTVQVSLCVGDGHRVTLQWGKDSVNGETAYRQFDITNSTSVIMRKINGVPSLIVKSGKEIVILKTQDRQQVDTWMDVIHEMITGVH